MQEVMYSPSVCFAKGWTQRSNFLSHMSTFGTGCATTVVVDGHRMNAGCWQRDEAEIRQRASFDLECDESDLELVVMSTRNRCVKDGATQIGVRGCDQSAVYVWTYDSGWVMNTGPQR